MMIHRPDCCSAVCRIEARSMSSGLELWFSEVCLPGDVNKFISDAIHHGKTALETSSFQSGPL